MSRVRDPWRDDRLGRLVRLGLHDLGAATPPPRVWERIAARIEPRPSIWRRLAGWLLAPSVELPTASPQLVSLRAATLMSLLVVAILTTGGVGSHLDSLRPSTPRVPGGGAAAPHHGLTAPRTAAQPAAHRQPVGRNLPSERPSLADTDPQDRTGEASVPREVASRAQWWPPAPGPRGGPVTPLAALHGQ
jgi:hypothetical protein